MIKQGQVVTLGYVLKSSTGEVLDQSNPAQPFLYLHGAGQIVPGLENALEGKAIGYKGLVTVKPAEGYGEEIPELKIQVERSAFPADMDPQPGMRVSAQGGPQPLVLTIEKVEGTKVFLNGNHPLAGQTLFFDVEILSSREATQEERDHGHVHGDGGHHH
jgi:FKBP-type peptidyl-prolyl cis-trans isomerase SlyD